MASQLAFRAGCWGGVSADRTLSPRVLSVFLTVWNILFLGITGPVFVDSRGERCMDYSVYALRKSRNGSFFLPVVHYDGYQRVNQVLMGHVFEFRSYYRKRPERRGRAWEPAGKPSWGPVPIIHHTLSGSL